MYNYRIDLQTAGIYSYYNREHRGQAIAIDVSLIHLDVHESKLEWWEYEEETWESRREYLAFLSGLLQKRYPSLNLSVELRGRCGKHLCLIGDYDLDDGVATALDYHPARQRALVYAVEHFAVEARKLFKEFVAYWESPAEV